MAPFLAPHQSGIAAVCRRYGVRRAEAFGSVVTANFAADSDVDFLVDFNEEPTPGMTLLDRYLGVKESLEDLLRHPVDIVMPGGITNPYFREAVDEQRELVYAA